MTFDDGLLDFVEGLGESGLLQPMVAKPNETITNATATFRNIATELRELG